MNDARQRATRVRGRVGRALGVTVALAAATVGATASPAMAAVATVGNGLATTDLSAVGMTPASLAGALVGPGVSVSNASFSGGNPQAGLIHLVDPAVASFNDGVILSSGNVADVVGPNKSDGITGDMAGPNDPDLDALIAATQTVNPITFDAAVLEFDFVPTTSTVYFTYTFGSDEYLEWVNLFNDVFAFYVNGTNCATVPGGAAVSIDTINDAVNPALFRDNSFSAPPANPINIESDGLSVEMICTAPVNPGQTNHMKLAIADTSDQILDSVVMIKSHSLSTVKPESCNDGIDNDDDALVDDADDSCTATTTPPPVGSGGIGTGGNAPPFTGNEGTPIPLDASALGWTASPEALTATWTVTGINGTPGGCDVSDGPLPIGPGGSIPVVAAVCPNEGEYVAKVEGIDAEGKSAFDFDVDFIVHNAPPAVSIDAPSSGASFAPGDDVVVSATVVDPGVLDTNSCEVSWGDGSTEPGLLVGGTCSASHTYSGTGSYALSVTGTDDAGDSSAAAIVVDVTDLHATATTLTTSTNPSVAFQPIVLRATVTTPDPGAGVPTGSVEYSDGGVPLGVASLVGGQATLLAKPSAGIHTYTATYTGSTTFAASTTVTGLDQSVDQAATAVTVKTNINPTVFGQNVMVSATVKVVAPATGRPVGSVDIFDDGVLIGSPTIQSGTAWVVIRPSTGTHHYTASYDGSPNHAPSDASVPVSHVVEPAAVGVTLTSTLPTTTVGHDGNLVAGVRAIRPGTGMPTGTVTFSDGGSPIATVALVNGRARLALASLAVGTHAISATYDGDANFAPATTAATFTQVIV